jgi:hypothetical protein
MVAAGFREPVFTPFETFLFDIVAADFNRDGLDDLAYLDTDSTNGDERIGVMLGQADGTLAPAGWRGLGQRPNDLRAIDLDGDGRDELVVAVDERFRSVRVARVGLDGSLTTPLAYFSGENAEEVAGGDVDGDGAIDLVCVNEDIDAMHVLLGDGSGGL